MGRPVRVALAIAVSAVLVGALFASVDVAASLPRLAEARLSWLGVGAAFSLIVLVARGARFRALTRQADLTTVTAASAVHNFLVRVTPLRLGELSLPYFLERAAAEPVARSLVSLVLVRLLELWMVVAAGLVAFAVTLGGSGAGELVGAGAVAAALTVVLATFSRWLRLAARIAHGVARSTRLDARPRVARVLEQIDRAIDESASLSTARRVQLLVSSAAVALGQYAMLGALAYAFGLDLAPVQVVVGVTLAQIASALPVGGVGAFGTYEAGWTGGFVAVGVALDDAVVTAVATQLVTLAFAAVQAAPCWWLLRRRTPTATS